jgi:hypothetical protein
MTQQRPIHPGLRVGARTALRAMYDVKCVCRTCTYLLTTCEEVTATKSISGGTIIVLDCSGYQREMLSPREIEELKKREQ